MENTNIIDRITKLLALSHSPNENEAQAASAKAQELLMLYNLKPKDVVRTDSQSLIRIQEIDSSTKKVFWKIFLVQDIAQANFCSACRRGKQLIAVGQQHNVAAVKALYDYLTKTVERLATESSKTEKQLYQAYLKQIEGTGITPQTEPNWRTWRNSFITGCSKRLRERLLEQKQCMERDGIAATNTTNAVSAIACRSAYEREAAAIKQWQQSQGITVTSYFANSKVKLTPDGYSAGVKAGNQISLNRQVKAQSHEESPASINI